MSASSRRKVEAASTNVIVLDLPSLVTNATIMTGEPLACKCGAVFSSVSAVDKTSNKPVWSCDFCGVANDFTLSDEEKPAVDTVDYLISGPTAVGDASADTHTVILVCDFSGSMAVTTETNQKLKGRAAASADVLAFREQGAAQYLPNERRDVQYVSRLQCVQAAVEYQIETLAKKSPNVKVGVVVFNSEVTCLGDGTTPACHHCRRSSDQARSAD